MKLFMNSITNINAKVAMSRQLKDFRNNNIIPNFLLGQYFGVDTLNIEDMFAMFSFTEWLTSERIGLEVYQVDDYARPDSDTEGNIYNLSLLKDILNIHVASNHSGSDGSIQQIEFDRSAKVFYNNDSLINSKFEKNEILFKNKLLKNNEAIPLEIGYTSYSKTYCQLINHKAIARYPYEPTVKGVIPALWVLYLLE